MQCLYNNCENYKYSFTGLPDKTILFTPPPPKKTLLLQLYWNIQKNWFYFVWSESVLLEVIPKGWFYKSVIAVFITQWHLIILI